MPTSAVTAARRPRSRSRAHSGDADKPRILSTFNEPISDWLSFFCFTYFTDRDGKYQLKSLAESGFDPLSRTCRFMLTEEAHHMFVGETGIGRVVRRTLEVMKELGTDDPERIRAHGAVDLGLLQKYLNFWCSSSLDLFGSEISSNAAANFASGLKGRPDEPQYPDHVLREAIFKMQTPEGVQDVPMLNALNEVMRESYLKDCEIGLKRWNRSIERAGHAFRSQSDTEVILHLYEERRSGAKAEKPSVLCIQGYQQSQDGDQ